MRWVNWSLSTGVLARYSSLRLGRPVCGRFGAGAKLFNKRTEAGLKRVDGIWLFANGVDVTVNPEPPAFGVRTRVAGSCKAVGTTEKLPARISGVIVVKKFTEVSRERNPSKLLMK